MKPKLTNKQKPRRIPQGFVVVPLSSVSNPDRWRIGTAQKADKTKVYRQVAHPVSGNQVSPRNLTERERAKLPKPVTLRVPGYLPTRWPDLNSAKAHALQCHRKIAADLYKRGLELPEKGIKYQLVYRHQGGVRSWYEHTGSITHPFQRILNVEGGSTAPSVSENAWFDAPSVEEKAQFKEVLEARHSLPQKRIDRDLRGIGPENDTYSVWPRVPIEPLVRPQSHVMAADAARVDAQFTQRDLASRAKAVIAAADKPPLDQGQIEYIRAGKK